LIFKRCVKSRRGFYIQKKNNEGNCKNNPKIPKIFTYRYPLEHDNKEFREDLVKFIFLDQKYQNFDIKTKVFYTSIDKDNKIVFIDKNSFFEAEFKFKTLKGII